MMIEQTHRKSKAIGGHQNLSLHGAYQPLEEKESSFLVNISTERSISASGSPGLCLQDVSVQFILQEHGHDRDLDSTTLLKGIVAIATTLYQYEQKRYFRSLTNKTAAVITFRWFCLKTPPV